MLIRRLLLATALLSLSTPLWAKKVDLDYHVRFLPDTEEAEVSLILEDGAPVISLAFNLGEQGAYSDFKADGQWTQNSAELGTWKPGKGKSTLSYRVRINNERSAGRFDALITKDWALLRSLLTAMTGVFCVVLVNLDKSMAANAQKCDI